MAHSRRGRLAGRLLVMAATVFWGASATVARYLFSREQVPFVWAVQMRLGIAALLLGAWLAIRHRGALRVPRSEWGYFLVLGLVGVASVQGSYYFTISVLGVGLGILLQYLAPAIVVGFEVISGRERFSLRTMAILGAAIAGTALLVVGAREQDWKAPAIGWVMGFASAFFFAFYILFSKRGLSRFRSETVLFYTFLVAGAFWMTVSPVGRLFGAGLTPRIWWFFLFLAVFSTLVPFWLFYSGLRRLSPSEAGIVATLEPLVAVSTSALFLGEGLTAPQSVGAGLVLAACVMASRLEDPIAAGATSETARG